MKLKKPDLHLLGLDHQSGELSFTPSAGRVKPAKQYQAVPMTTFRLLFSTLRRATSNENSGCNECVDFLVTIRARLVFILFGVIVTNVDTTSHRLAT